jgi:tRNA (guanine26-N2/guanine27-N2)-dimethyltransferase
VYKRHIVPLVSLSIDYYIRVFVRVFTSANKVKESASKMGTVIKCLGCDVHDILPMMRLVQAKGKKGNTYLQYKLGQLTAPRECGFCGRNFHMAGPVWIAPTVDKPALQALMAHLNENQTQFGSYSRLFGRLHAMNEVCNCNCN